MIWCPLVILMHVGLGMFLYFILVRITNLVSIGIFVMIIISFVSLRCDLPSMAN